MAAVVQVRQVTSAAELEASRMRKSMAGLALARYGDPDARQARLADLHARRAAGSG